MIVTCHCFFHPAKKLRSGAIVRFSDNSSSILQGHSDKPPSLVKPINMSYMFPTHQYTTEIVISLVRLSRFALRASPITHMRLVDPDQRVITGLKCNKICKLFDFLNVRT